MPQARSIALPELLAGASGAPIECARWFHRAFFGHAETLVEAGTIIVLEHVVVGRHTPALRELELWGRARPPEVVTAMTADQVAAAVGSDARLSGSIVTASDLIPNLIDVALVLDDRDHEVGVACALLMSTITLLASAAPYVVIGDARGRGASSGVVCSRARRTVPTTCCVTASLYRVILRA